MTAALVVPPGAADVHAFERIEAEGYADLYAAAPAGAATGLGLGWGRVGGAECRLAAGVPGHRLLNQVACAPSGLDLDAVAALYAQAGAAGFVVGASPAAPGLRSRLEQAGWVPRNTWAKFVRSTASVPGALTGLDVVEAAPGHAGAAGAVVADAFELPAAAGPMFSALVGRPGWTCFVALDGDDVAGFAALRVDSGVGWLAFAATRDDFRRRGAQAALLAARIETARALGCDIVMVEAASDALGAPSQSWRNIRRAGFELAYVRANLGPAT